MPANQPNAGLRICISAAKRTRANSWRLGCLAKRKLAIVKLIQWQLYRGAILSASGLSIL